MNIFVAFFHNLSLGAQKALIQLFLMFQQDTIFSFTLSLWHVLHKSYHGAYLLRGPQYWGKKELWIFLETLLILDIPPEKNILIFFKHYGEFFLEDLQNHLQGTFGDLWKKKSEENNNIVICGEKNISLGMFFHTYGQLWSQVHPQGFFLPPGGSKENIHDLHHEIFLKRDHRSFILCPNIHESNVFGATRLLALLEQPLDNRIFFLTTQERILKTIESRCFLYDVPPWEEKIPLFFQPRYFFWLQEKEKKDHYITEKKIPLKKNQEFLEKPCPSYETLNPKIKTLLHFLAKGSLGLLKEMLHNAHKIHYFFSSFEKFSGICPLDFEDSKTIPLWTLQKTFSLGDRKENPSRYPYGDPNFMATIEENKDLFFKVLWLFWYFLENLGQEFLDSLSVHGAQRFLYFCQETRQKIQSLGEKEKTYGLSFPLVVMTLYKDLGNINIVGHGEKRLIKN